MNNSSAYLLVTHGSRDPRPKLAAEYLAKLVSQRLPHISPPPSRPSVQKAQVVRSPRADSTGRPNQPPAASDAVNIPTLAEPRAVSVPPPVGTAVLELAPIPLHQQIQQFAKRALAAGHRHLQILPLFLLPGVHVMEDVPSEVAIAQQALGQSFTLELRPHLGSHPNLPLLLHATDAIASSDRVANVLMAHGSRRPDSNQFLEALAAGLGALPAYWSIAPSLDDQVAELVDQGYQQISILPYFLFAGGITDAIVENVNALAHRFPKVQFELAQPIGVTPDLADLIVDLVHQTHTGC